MSIKNKLFSCPTNTIDEFECFAKKALDLGATHIYVSDLPKSIWQWDRDRNDPYPAWGMESSAIFKVVMPQKLKPFLPADYASSNISILKERAEVLKRLGMKAAFHGCEPGWLPEEVYRAFPSWRGARCDHPRRARKAYFSPCLDHPEVVEMYRDAVKELCSIIPIEYFNFKTNDAGGGLCWSAGLYPGINGATHCTSIPMAQRVTGFLSAIQMGAGKAGVDATAGFGSGIPESEAKSIMPYLKPGQFVGKAKKDGIIHSGGAGFFSDYYSSCTYPVIGIPQVVKFAEQLEDLHSSKVESEVISFQSLNSLEYFELYQRFMEKPTIGVVNRYVLLREIAQTFVGTEKADALTTCWDYIYKAVENMRLIDNGGNVILLGCVSQRWLNRPFVPFPLELSAEERDYFREFQFQANSEEEAADLMNLQGQEHINGYSGTWLATKYLEQSILYYQKAARMIEQILESITGQDYKARLEILRLRIKAMICLIRTAVHAARYQEILDRTDYFVIPEDSTKVWTDQGDPRLKQLQNLARAEIDNVLELAHLMETSEEPLLMLAANPSQEYTFAFGPDLKVQLRKKAGIMMDHLLDLNRLYTRFNN